MRSSKLWWSCLALLTVVAGASPSAGAGPLPHAGERRLALEKASVLGSVLYVAAHPDDENTAMLAYLARGRRLRTAYLSLTRGDGGQNLIGTEQGDALGAIRTQELLAARRVDGAEQFFTRAVDFGFSKTAEETLRIWGRDEILADVVWVIRSFRPDVIITRFPESGDGGHGHHTASAILAREAFEAAGDPRRFPEQLAHVAPWKPTRLLWNAWRQEGQPQSGAVRLTVDLGTYDPLLGQAYTELAAIARTFHKSQGFGSSPRRGPVPNELELVAGTSAEKDLMEGVETSWRRLPGGEAVEAALARARAAYTDTAPHLAVPALLEAREALGLLAPDPWIEVKRRELDALVQACAGLWLEARAAEPSVSPGSTLRVMATAINRSPLPLRLLRVAPSAGGVPLPADSALGANQPKLTELALAIPPDMPVTHPYWLAGVPRNGRHEVADPRLVGRPEAPPPLQVAFTIALGGSELELTVPVVHGATDPVNGERLRPVAIVPPVTATFTAPVHVFADSAPRPVRLRVRAHRADAVARLALRLPPGFTATPPALDVQFARLGEEKTVTFEVTAPASPTVGEIAAVVVGDSPTVARGAVFLDHPHIPPVLLLPPAVVRAVRVEATAGVRRIGYLPGAGDEVADVLRQLGLEVVTLDETSLDAPVLASLDAVVTGVRAANTREGLAAAMPALLRWVEGGGTLVMQYNTERGLDMRRFAPFPLRLSRDRVTDETAPVRFLVPEHPSLTTPNRLTGADFAGWVQERGLYFASEWDPAYTAPLGMADPGEKELAGALLVARHGKGTFVYTGLAFFRQLPAGNPGAIRLFLNLLGTGRKDG
ncbi:MAG TPA: PIG-L family deacetylase [Thermoanaerobaculaceae bacterium]|mgnify:CR=1 FL=1|nr:PIG-L family deacetylase [Thermoanaerobaculaceae bacterium]HRS17005.1 PIG-L family deacetylase [Thermoanaerobaculaceae bacterium]